MKRKGLGILLAAILAVSGPATAVFASDFGEPEIDLFLSESVEEDSFSSGEEEEEEAVFTDSEAPILTEQGAYRAHYEGGYISKEQFEQWKQTGEEPENWVQVGFYDTLVSPEELFAKMN